MQPLAVCHHNGELVQILLPSGQHGGRMERQKSLLYGPERWGKNREETEPRSGRGWPKPSEDPIGQMASGTTHGGCVGRRARDKGRLISMLEMKKSRSL